MSSPNFAGLKALFINCTLKKSPAESHTQTLMDVSKRIMKNESATVDEIRLIDHDVPPGVNFDMTENGYDKDEWPDLWKRINAADILIIGTPIWLGEKSSVAQKLIERLYAMMIAESNDKGQNIFYGKVGGCIITGNEDGAKHCSMGILYSLQHVGFSIPPQADSAWLGEVGPGPSYGDTEYNDKKLDSPAGFDTNFTNRNTTILTYNLLHLARMLKEQNGYPGYGNSKKAWSDGERWKFEKPEKIHNK